MGFVLVIGNLKSEIFLDSRDKISNLRSQVSELATSSQLGAAGSGIRFDFKFIRCYRTLRQQLYRGPRPTVANARSLLTLALTRQAPQLALHDPVFKRVKTDYNKAAVSF
jgi:hypothetical protein